METYRSDTRANLLTLIAAAICASVGADIVHEALGHGVISWLTGNPIMSISSVALQTASNSRLVSAAGTSANVIAGSLALWLLAHVRVFNASTLFL